MKSSFNKKNIFSKKRIFVVTSFLILFGILGFVFPVGAVPDAVVSATMSLLGFLLMPLISLLGKILIVLIDILIQIASYNDFINAAAVDKGWVIMRDVGNMFFIVILMAIAFGTILKIEAYHYKKLLPKLLIMAILINFSKMLCGLMIDFGQVAMMTFVNAFKDAAAGNLIGAFGLREMMVLRSATSVTISEAEVAGALILALVMLSIAVAVVCVMLFVLLGRIIALWILVILSPIVYVASAAGLTKYTSQWWSSFSKYVIVGPVLAFFLWLSMAMMQQETDWLKIKEIESQEELLQQRTQTQDDQGMIYASISSVSSSESILSFMVAIAMLIGSLAATQQLGVVGSQMAGNLKSKIGDISAKVGKGIVAAPAKGAWGLVKYGERKTHTATGFGGFNPKRMYQGFKETMEKRKRDDEIIGTNVAGAKMRKGGLGGLAVGVTGATRDAADTYVRGFMNIKGGVRALKTVFGGDKRIKNVRKDVAKDEIEHRRLMQRSEFTSTGDVALAGHEKDRDDAIDKKTKLEDELKGIDQQLGDNDGSNDQKEADLLDKRINGQELEKDEIEFLESRKHAPAMLSGVLTDQQEKALEKKRDKLNDDAPAKKTEFKKLETKYDRKEFDQMTNDQIVKVKQHKKLLDEREQIVDHDDASGYIVKGKLSQADDDMQQSAKNYNDFKKLQEQPDSDKADSAFNQEGQKYLDQKIVDRKEDKKRMGQGKITVAEKMLREKEMEGTELLLRQIKKELKNLEDQRAIAKTPEDETKLDRLISEQKISLQTQGDVKKKQEVEPEETYYTAGEKEKLAKGEDVDVTESDKESRIKKKYGKQLENIDFEIKELEWQRDKGVSSDEDRDVDKKAADDILKKISKKEKKILSMQGPQAYYAMRDYRALQSEEEKKIGGTQNEDELIAMFNTALQNGDKVNAAAVAKAATSAGHLNEILWSQGYRSDGGMSKEESDRNRETMSDLEWKQHKGLSDFMREVFGSTGKESVLGKKGLGFDEQSYLVLQNDLSDAAQGMNHWQMAQTVGVKDGKYKQNDFVEQQHRVSVEMSKADKEGVMRRGNRLAFGPEVLLDPGNPEAGRRAVINPAGLFFLEQNFKGLASNIQKGRYNGNAIMNIMLPHNQELLRNVQTRMHPDDRAEFGKLLVDLKRVVREDISDVGAIVNEKYGNLVKSTLDYSSLGKAKAVAKES